MGKRGQSQNEKKLSQVGHCLFTPTEMYEPPAEMIPTFLYFIVIARMNIRLSKVSYISQPSNCQQCVRHQNLNEAVGPVTYNRIDAFRIETV
jgi:hypothetical protein